MQKVFNIYNREEDILNYLPTDVYIKDQACILQLKVPHWISKSTV